MSAMTEIADDIAARLEETFAARGFAEPGVDALRQAAGVSLRTLYKYFPSREAMVLGALEHRHRTYLAALVAELPAGPGDAPIHHLVERLGAWMADRSPRGCLFVQALAAHPASGTIRAAVVRHKGETRAVIAECVRRARPGLDDEAGARLTDSLLIVHEGQTALSASLGAEAATAAARSAITALLDHEDAR